MTAPAPPPTSQLSSLLPDAYLDDVDLATGWTGRRPSFRRMVEGGDENSDRAYVLKFRRPIGGVFLDADLPDCLPYHTRAGSLPLPRDNCAGALADAVLAAEGTLDVPAMLVDGWVVMAAEDDRSTDGQGCVERAAAIADRLDQRMAELRTAMVAPPPAAKPTLGSPVPSTTEWWRRRASSRDEYPVPVGVDLIPGAEAVRVHVREPLGPEVERRLCVGWQTAASQASAYWARQESTPYRPLDNGSETGHLLLSDRQVVLRRLVSTLGPDVDVVDSVGMLSSQSRDSVLSSHGVMDVWTVVAGKDAAASREDQRLVAAARRLAAAGPHVFDSPGRWYLLGRDLGFGVLTPAALAHGHEGGGDPTHVRAEIAIASNRRNQNSLSLAWATRTIPGSELFVDVSTRPPHVTVTGGDDAGFADLLVPILTERAAELAPSRWAVTPHLVVAVGTRQLRIGRFGKGNSSTGPTAGDLGSALKQVDDLGRSRGVV